MIKLDENFSLEADNLQWTLHYENTRIEEDPKTHVLKTVTSTSQSFHGEILFALKAYCNKSLKPCASAVDLKQRIEKLWQMIEGLDTKHVNRSLQGEVSTKKRLPDNYHVNNSMEGYDATPEDLEDLL